MEITLNESEQAIVNWIATQRNKANRDANTYSYPTVSGMSGFEIDQQGFGGELAFCRMCNVFPDLNTVNRSAWERTDQGDCKLRGYTVDVKTAKRADSALWVPERKNGSVQLYALVVGVFPTFKMVGFAWSEFVFDEKHRRETAQGVQYVVRQDELIANPF